MTRRRTVAGLIAACVAASFSFVSGAVAHSIVPAKIHFAVTLENKTGERAKDYHVTVEHLPETDLLGNPIPDAKAPTPIHFVRGSGGGSFGGPFAPDGKNGDGTPKVTGNDTIKISVNLNGDFDSTRKNTVSFDLLAPANEVQVTESYFTDKDHKSIGSKGIPGFKISGDPEYTLINNFDVSMGIRGLQFLVNVAELPFDTLDPGSVPGFGPKIADFVLGAQSSLTFLVPGDLAPGNFLYAQGLVFDSEFTEQTTSFIHGHQEPVPEPSTAVLAGTGLLIAVRAWRRKRRNRKVP